MPKYIHLHIVGTEKAVVVKADKIDREKKGLLVLKDGETEVGEFQSDQVAGWWIADHE